MIVALVDIGNTNINVILLKNEQTISSFDISPSTQSLFHFFSINVIDHFFISSVVPSINATIQTINPSKIYFLTHQDFSHLTINVTPIESVGIDRLVNAVAIANIIKKTTLIIDIGSAVTFCKVEKNGDYCGGIIMPGFNMIKNALYQHAEQLPLVQFPNTQPLLIGTSTESAIESGLFYGAIHMINGIQTDIKKKEAIEHTIITGGVPSPLLNHLNHDEYNPDLQFDGLKILFARHGAVAK